MNDKERDQIDDLFRDSLYNFEAETDPADWMAIESRLPEQGKVVSFHNMIKYWSAAAAILLIAVSTGVFLLRNDVPDKEIQVQTIINTTETQSPSESNIPNQNNIASVSEVSSNNAVVKKESQKPKLALMAYLVDVPEDEDYSSDLSPVEYSVSDNKANDKKTVARSAMVMNNTEKIRSNNTKETATIEQNQKTKSRKWGFGMGGGSITAGSNNTLQSSVLKNTLVDDTDFDRLNAASNNSLSTNVPNTNVSHKMPVSFGLGVSYYLNDRWALQSGLNYSMLISDWASSGIYHGETRQKLHFIGLPLSVSYKIAEWNKFRWYASAGGMAEINVAGKTKTTLYSGTEKMGTLTEHTRMKEVYWSLNANTGISYPIIKFVSAFAEVGASYYFDNGTEIETIHSDKPFNVNLSIGLRLGF